MTAENYATAKNSPHLEIFEKEKIEVLLLTDPIDEWLVTHLTEYGEKPLTSVNKGELDLGDLASGKKRGIKPKKLRMTSWTISPNVSGSAG